MGLSRKEMVVSRWWVQVAIVTFAAGFAVLGLMAYYATTRHPPTPEKVVTTDGAVLFTGRQILRGQDVFRKYGLMQHGTLFGHGAYLGPDFTAEYLHRGALAMQEYYAGPQGVVSPAVRQQVRDELRNNAWRQSDGTLTFTPGQVHAYRMLVEYYTGWFGPAARQQGVKGPPSPTRRRFAT